MKLCTRCERAFSTDQTLKMHHTRVHPLSDSVTLDFLNMDRIAQAGVIRQVIDRHITGGELDQYTMAIMRGDDPDLMTKVRNAMTYFRGIEYRYVIAELP